MELTFHNLDELKDFYKQLKGTRGGKADADDASATAAVQIPAPIQPPAGNVAFTPPAASSPFAVAGTPVPAVDPAITAVVARINARTSSLVQSGTKVEDMLGWFRSELVKAGQDAAAATLEQVQNVFLPKLSLPVLENIAKLTGA